MTPEGLRYGDVDNEFFLVMANDIYAAYNWAEQAGAAYVLNLFIDHGREDKYNSAYINVEIEDINTCSQEELENFVCINEFQLIELEL